jgi:arsenical pump membrane protein
MDHLAIGIISLLAIGGVIFRPFRIREVWWALSGAFLLMVLGLLHPSEGVSAIIKGTDVYLFLMGMMLLAETAREEQLFDWLAAHATKLAKGFPARLFLLIYVVGIIVTVFLSNDATAVVLTPAVAAAMRAAKVQRPLPWLLICAFVANAASFVLPISNPANLVIYGSHLPPLLEWLPAYMLPSLMAIGITYFTLRWTQRKALKQPIGTDIRIPELSRGANTALWGIGVTALVLLTCSALDLPLGLPTAITGLLISALVMLREKRHPRTVIRGVSWSVLPLVAGLFVIVEAWNKTGLIRNLAAILHRESERSAPGAAWGGGILVALVSNLMNNLPAGLVAGNVVHLAQVPEIVRRAVLIGVTLGPNLSVTGSLATILWLVALRREGQEVSAWTFLKIGALVMTAALLFALAALFI